MPREGDVSFLVDNHELDSHTFNEEFLFDETEFPVQNRQQQHSLPTAVSLSGSKRGPPRQTGLTRRCPTILYLSCDPEHLSQYQCLVRKQIELFEANETDVEAGAQGRNKPIVLGQVCS